MIYVTSGRFPLDQKFRNFRNGVKWHFNFLGKVPENAEISETEPFNRNFWEKIKWNENIKEKVFEMLGIPQEVVLFFGNYVDSRFSVHR